LKRLTFEVKQKLEKEEQERIEIEEMDEESYEALPEKRRREIDSKLLFTKKLRLKKYSITDTAIFCARLV
jgi:hypothetical protein